MSVCVGWNLTYLNAVSLLLGLKYNVVPIDANPIFSSCHFVYLVIADLNNSASKPKEGVKLFPLSIKQLYWSSIN